MPFALQMFRVNIRLFFRVAWGEATTRNCGWSVSALHAGRRRNKRSGWSQATSPPGSASRVTPTLASQLSGASAFMGRLRASSTSHERKIPETCFTPSLFTQNFQRWLWGFNVAFCSENMPLCFYKLKLCSTLLQTVRTEGYITTILSNFNIF